MRKSKLSPTSKKTINPLSVKVTAKPLNKNPSKKKKSKKLFVLDTNVLLHDPDCLYNFQDNDIALPMTVLEELDNHKRGLTEVARNARQANRVLDLLLSNCADFSQGVSLSQSSHGKVGGILYFVVENLTKDDWEWLGLDTNDNQILAVVRQISRRYLDRQVVLVSKDINIRVKAMALGLRSEDYRTDQALDDSQLLYSGFHEISSLDWDNINAESWVSEGKTHYRIKGNMVKSMQINQAVFMKSSGESSHANFALRVTQVIGNVAELTQIKDHAHPRNAVWGIFARNREQNVAIDLLLDPNIDLVTILGAAGTGKTLMTLACAIAQTFDDNRFEDIIITRATIPIGDDIGFLPGTEEEKMNPWMGALEDNLQVLTRPNKPEVNAINGQVATRHEIKGTYSGASGYGGGYPSRQQFHQDNSRDGAIEFLRSRIKVKSLSFMRGRTFTQRFLIIDEAQNLTPAQLKSLITRAGAGTKVVCLGNLAQIDTPYLTPLTSGLTWLVERFKNWPHSGHIVLQRGERSRLADFAEQALAM